MTVYSVLKRQKSRLFGGALMAVLLCGTAGHSLAQGEAPAEQLPPGFAQEQVPPAFQMDDQPQAADTAAPAAAPADSETATEGDAAEAEGGEIPAQPEAKQLVPATPMGTAAQNVKQGAAPSQPPAAEEAQADDSAGMEDQAPALPDILDKYTEATEDVEGPGDALPPPPSPQTNTVNAVKIQGEGFDLGNRTARVEIDGNLNEEGNAKLQDEIRAEAFDAAITGMFPLSPEQIEGLLKRYDGTQKAAKKPPYDVPTPEISVQNVSLDPGVAPPVIKTAIGNVTTINILDATGAPWPVQDVTWAGDYEVVEPESGGHIIRITPMSHFARGNIVVRMLTLKTPLTFTLETGRDVVQYRVDARIPEYGPFATTPIMQGGKSLVAGTPELTSILDGVAPSGAVKLAVSGVDGRTTAYTMGGTTYVRTPLTLLSPAWQSSVSSADGMNVYALSNAPVLLLSDGGEFQRAILKEKEDLLDE
ncbi:MAG TPA: DotH/IcmK family type IV secretion protein [Micavibrio sp.]|nr:DotH/IcmK family type IV secretion protein [Micavibrio sp.]